MKPYLFVVQPCTILPHSGKTTNKHTAVILQSCSGLDPSWQTLDCTPSFSENWTVRVEVTLLTVGVLLKNEISGRITTGEKDRKKQYRHVQIILA